MWILYDNLVVIVVALLASVYAWLFGGTDAALITPVVPWLFAILLEAMLCFPQRHRGETTYEVRARVWSALRRDPLTWVTLGFFILLAIPFFNRALCPFCDYEAIRAGADPQPTFPFLPFCVDRLEHFNVVLWFVPVLTAMLAVKHALLKRGKRLVLELIVWNGVAIAVVGVIQSATGANFPLWADLWMDEVPGSKTEFFSTFGYPNMAGDYFTTLFALAIGLWRAHVEEVRKSQRDRDPGHVTKFRFDVQLRKHFMLVPAVIFFFSAMMTLSRAAIMLVSLMAILAVVHAVPCFMKRMPRAKRVLAAVVAVPVLAVVILSTYIFMPSEVLDGISREIGTLDSQVIADRLSSKGQYHGRVAWEIFKKYPVFGCGGWGYKHFSVVTMIEKVEEPQRRIREAEAAVAKVREAWSSQTNRVQLAKERLASLDEADRRPARYEAEEAARQAQALEANCRKAEKKLEFVRRETQEGAAGEEFKQWEKDLRSIQMTGGINVHNDYLQFMDEHGAVGFACLVALVVLLVVPLSRVWRVMYNAVRFTPNREQPPVPVGLFVLPAPAFFILAAAAATFVHGFGDCPFRSPAVLMLFFVSLAAMDGFLPHIHRE
ncbi:MAG: hypothetical protein ACI4R9_05770 [Kiritimatiellia bacterium]